MAFAVFLVILDVSNKYTENISKGFQTVMTSAMLPSILVPLVGLVFPAVAMASMFLYIEKEQIN
nr:photosystem I reaction center subunit VIII [Chlorella desiccata (nom. nud.)]